MLMLVVVIATVCMFLTVFFTPVSYPLMVFWLNIGFVLVYTLLGAEEFDLLFARPSTTLLGALVAALVVVYVFPIRITDRFKAAVARFLGAVDGYVAAFVAAMTKGRRGTDRLRSHRRRWRQPMRSSSRHCPACNLRTTRWCRPRVD